MTYHHLTYPERQRIERLLSCGYSQAAIARRLDVHRSTIKKEIDRNSFRGKYDAAYAEQLSQARKKERGSYKQKKKSRRRRSFWLFRRTTIAFNEPRYRIFFTFGTDSRVRDKRKQRDYRKRKGFRFRNEPDMDYQIIRTYYLRRRERDHWREGLRRKERTLYDFMCYNRAIWREWGFTEDLFICKYRRKKKRNYPDKKTRRGRYNEPSPFAYALNEEKPYIPYRFTRFDWLFRPPNPAGNPSHLSFEKESQPHPSPTQSQAKRKYTPKVKAPSLKTIKSRPSLRKPAGKLCPVTGEKLTPPALKRKREAKKHPHTCKPPSVAYFFA